MTDSKHSRLWVAVVAGVAVFGIASWFTRSGSPEASKSIGRETMAHSLEAGSAVGLDPIAVDSALRIAEHGRLSLDADALPDEGPLTLVLDLPDRARGQGPHPIRIVSTDGRRIDTTASPLAGAGTGVQLEIDADFLSRGLYMIEIDTTDPPPLQIRRYVLELK